MAGRQADEAGFSIMEFILAMTLLLIILVATAQAFTGATRVSGNVRQRVVASNLATQTLEKLRAASNNSTTFANIPISTTTTNSPVLDGTIFAITQDVEWEGVGSAGTACDAGNNRGLLLRATVTVNWPGSATTVQSSTLLAPPLGSYSATNGAVGIKVFTSAGVGNAGVSVAAISGGVTVQTIATGTDGCAFFDSLPAGAYTFTLVQTSPFGVDSQEAHVSTTPIITVAVGTTVQNPPVSYDDGSTIVYTFSPVAGPPVASGMSVSAANVTLTQGFFPLLVSGAGPAYTLYPVYPFPSGYTLFAGDCSDSNPLGKDSSATRFYPTAPPPTAIAVAPDGTALGTAQLYPLNINVISNAGAAVSNPSFTAVSNPTVTTFGGACPYGSPSYTLTNGGGGGLSSTGLGLGHLRIVATGKVGGVNKFQTVYIWIQPDGVYMADSVTGAKGSLVYLFTAPTSLQIRLGP